MDGENGGSRTGTIICLKRKGMGFPLRFNCDKIMWLCSICCSLVLLPIVAVAQGGKQNQDSPIPSGPTTNQDRVVDYEYCYEALNRHDSDFNNRITKSEFLGFCQDFGGNTECLAHLAELPIELQAVWNEITCECVRRGGAGDCCVGSNANIPINGVLATDATAISQQQFLRQACLRTDQAIIAHCGPPPIPPVIGPPGGIVVPSPDSSSWSPRDNLILTAIAAALLFLLCCCRRRWFLFPDKNDEDNLVVDSYVDPEAGHQHDPEQQNSALPHESGGLSDADATVNKSRFKSSEEQNQGGITTHGRMIQDPKYEEGEKNHKFIYERYDIPPKPEESIKLRPTERPPPPGLEDEPYIPEHYTPDGGIVKYEKTGKWGYNADGGVIPEIRPATERTEPHHPKYVRPGTEEQEDVDNRKRRNLSGYDGSEIFRELDKVPDSHASGFHGLAGWVVLESFNALNENAVHLEEQESDDSWDTYTMNA